MNNQMNNAVRKIHNLHSSGAVTVTGPNQPRILKQKVGATTVTPTNNLQAQTGSNLCYVCDDALPGNQQLHSLTDMQTGHSCTKFPNKIGQVVGDAYMVIVSAEDVICGRCANLINYLDRLESDVERVRTNLINLLHKKYGLNDDGGGTASPPIKMQKLNSGSTVTRVVNDDANDLNRTRKTIHGSVTLDSPLGKQSPPVSAVQQIKISTQPQVQQQQLTTATTQQVQRKTTKIYKCLSCDYKTSDMRLFNTHYETCKHQNFQCKNCKKIFPNFGAMKQHMVREHNTAMDNTCAVCHFNFINETALRKHMEMNHSTNVIVTSTTTLPASAVAAASTNESITAVAVASPAPATTSLYTCNHCQFKSTDKTIFDEHLRKHMPGVKPRPFKCRLCAQRFETREAATVHAKQHQPNYFKCGTCAMSFPKRELLVKHFEVHQRPATSSPQQSQTQSQTITTQVKQQQQQQQQTQQSPAALTQKLLQESINEALSETGVGVTTTTTSDVGATTTANNIRFFSCHICSLTFIQENYYNQHMETHRRDNKTNVTGSVTLQTNSLSNNKAALTGLTASTTGILTEGGLGKGAEAAEVAIAVQQSNAGGTTISEADIESIFEKMHSDKNDTSSSDAVTAANAITTTTTAAAVSGGTGKSGDNLVITSQEGSGGITFNITIPQPDGSNDQTRNEKNTAVTTTPVSVSIDMPVLDQPDETVPESTAGKANASIDNGIDEHEGGNNKGSTALTGPVSMPSLDDDNDAQEQAPAESHLEGNAEIPVAKSNEENVENNVSANIADDNKAEDHKDTGTTNAEAESTTNTVDSTGIEGTEHATEAVSGSGLGAAEAEAATAEQLAGAAANATDQQVAMELDEAMQAQVESGQIKFILNENGQLLQLDNHIITDAEGNQILVQDPEQIQQLLQSVGVLQSGDGLDGETLQMMADANGQMVLVQGENNETQLIDASLLNADGQLVIQQGQDGELGEGAHVIGEDGTRIPVSVSYTADGQPIVQVQQQVLEAAGAGEGGQHVVLDKDAAAAATAGAEGSEAQAADSAGGGANTAGGYFALEELMQPQSSEAKASE